jgi:hypothetical protein
MVATGATGQGGSNPVKHDATRAIRLDLMRRIDGLAAQRGHVSVPRIRDEVDQIRHIARSFHIDALEGLAGTLQTVLTLYGHGPVVLSYLDLMRDAAGESVDAVAIPAPHIVASAAAPHLRVL